MKKTIQDVNLEGKKVFVRVDFNVPLENGEVTDDTRIKKALPTIKHLKDQNAAVILASHLGRPKGEVVEKYRMDPVRRRLEELLGSKVSKSDCDYPNKATQEAEKLAAGDVMLMENLRFHPGEEDNEKNFAQGLASLAAAYVNDAFGAAHRAHASTQGITEYIDGPCVAGMLMEKELKFLGEVVKRPERPFVAVIGGAKISDKIGVIDKLMERADKVLIGGGMANTFLFAKGYSMGNSLLEQDAKDQAKELLEKAEQRGVELILPSDVVVTEELTENAPCETVGVSDIKDNQMAVDIGDNTADRFIKEIKHAQTVVMNGPMGVFETTPFDKGTVTVAKALADSQGTTVVGGGDSVSAIKQAGVEEQISHISTGGGASLKFLEGKTLPGVEALQE